ncbi:MAG: hypothetical protein PT934_06925 [Peptoniphilaceae bacterium]|uniref:hypothetical protein n=1 Tax=Parvimonas sp. TaxID=1944660 RepID=UPI0025E27445|nr:hypothetical protein [Parvimonas sp.]MDD7765483.1 hypothetical protein [Peptoniphilaceae bacterium]MDY3051024.1 hypothetical protein [Parvimonas sp.]
MNLELFKEQLKEKNFSQSYIFEGKDEFLKSLCSEFIQKVLNPMDDMKISAEILNQTHPDLMIIEPEKNTISIEKIRNMIEYVQIRPLDAKYKLVVINNADCLKNESSNALLKTLEESFDYVIICLLVKSRYKLLSTIRSRCIFVSESDNSFEFDFSLYEELFEIVSVTLNGDFSAIFNSKNKEYLLTLKEDYNFLPALYEFFKEFYIYIETGLEPNDRILKKFFKIHNDIMISKVDKILETIDLVRNNLYNNVNFQLSIEKIFVMIARN